MNGPQKTNIPALRRCLICFNSNKISPGDIYYFQLPPDPVTAAQWFRNLNRNELVKHLLQKNYSDSVWICSEHFPKSAIYINPMGVAILVPGTLPLIVKPDKKKPPAVILTSADRNLLFCRQKPVDTELAYFRQQFEKFQHFQQYRIHCTTCDAHINLAPLNKDQIRVHNFLKVIQCEECFHFDDKNGPLPVNKNLTIQCQCGVANTLVKCYCAAIFCKVCHWKNTDSNNTASKCLWCTPTVTLDLRALQWAVFKVLDFKYKSITTNEKYKNFTTERIKKLLEKDLAGCCGNMTVSSVPNKPLSNVEQSCAPNFLKTPNINVIKQKRPAETKTNDIIASKKIILSSSVGKPPVVMQKLPVISTVNCVQNIDDNVPPLTPITKTVVLEKVPVVASIAPIGTNEVVPPVQEPEVKLLTPVKNYIKIKKPPRAIAPKSSLTGLPATLPPPAKRHRPRVVLDDRCIEIKSNFKNNGTFLKTLCNHFMFKVENMQHTETSTSSVVNLHQQLISAIGDICDKLESVKEKCMQDLQKCSEAQVIDVPPPTVEPCLKDKDVFTAVSSDGPPVVDETDKEMVVSIPVVVPNDEEDEEEEVFELYDIIDTDFPECDVLIREGNADECNNSMEV